jgi:hypothetical protein
MLALVVLAGSTASAADATALRPALTFHGLEGGVKALLNQR